MAGLLPACGAIPVLEHWPISIERVNSVISALGAGAGGEFTLDKFGECVLESEDGEECVINAPAQGSAFTLSAVVGFVHDQDGDAFLGALLRLNADNEQMLGGTVSLDESGKVIVYRYVVDTDGLDGPRMMMLIGNFFIVADSLRREIRKLHRSSGGVARRPRPRQLDHARYI